jgi:hypothetical protein
MYISTKEISKKALPIKQYMTLYNVIYYTTYSNFRNKKYEDMCMLELRKYYLYSFIPILHRR